MREGVWLDVDEVEATEDLREAGNDRAVASRVVVQLKQRSRHQLVVAGHGEEGLLWELEEEESLVLFWSGAVCRDVGILGSLEVGSPPV